MNKFEKVAKELHHLAPGHAITDVVGAVKMIDELRGEGLIAAAIQQKVVSKIASTSPFAKLKFIEKSVRLLSATS
ncbi:MAG TPA: hypothetical protein VGL46_12490 [Pseudonocardiaceae bacterium]|jgi:hypothetical protein